MRVRVGGLKGVPPLKQAIERGLAARSGINEVRASAVTGTVLVLYDPLTAPDRIITLIIGSIRRPVVLSAPDELVPVGDGPGWHQGDADEVTKRLETSPRSGLSEEAARQRLRETGRNVLASTRGRSSAAILAGQFQTAPVMLLAVAAAASLATGALLEAGAILGVVALNGVIGYVTEARAERTIRSLSDGTGKTARVVRDGSEREIPAETLVPGDLVLLREGDFVPADARLLTSDSLTVGEAALTGESEPLTKRAQALPRSAIPLHARTNMVFRGTIVTGGAASALVVATGSLTEMGRIQRMVGAVSTPATPMQQRLEKFGRRIAWLSLAFGGLIIGIGMIRGYSFFQVVRSALSLAVAAVPEGLPALAATTLAFGIEDMRRRKVLVRRLDAVETLTSVRVVCFDKTGTLTLNRMSLQRFVCGDETFRPNEIRLDETARSVWAPAGIGRLLQIGALCNETELSDHSGKRSFNGSSTENALVVAALDCGIDVEALRRRYGRSAIRRRSEAYQLIATLHEFDGGRACSR